jgi:ATP-binding cassette subfamily B protein
VCYQRDYAADLKSTRLEEYTLTRFDKSVDDYVKLMVHFTKKTLGLSILQSGGSSLSQFAIVAYIAAGILSGAVGTIGMFASMLAASQQLSGNISVIFSLVTDLNEMSLYADRIRRFFETESHIEPPNPDAKPAPEGIYSVELRNVSFGYENSPFSLKNINIAIQPGQKIAVVGENGAGKSTLAKLLLRLYDIDSGDILINGAPIRDYDVRQLRSRVGIAFQTPNVYAMTLAENMQLYAEAGETRLREIIKTVGLTGVLEKAGGNLNTELTREFEEDGIMLSGGEAQKLGLARLFTREFGLLLLDEPSSALDPLAEYELAKVLFDKANSATTIMIAHRLSTIRGADIIFLVDDGEVTERGTHNELMALGGKYCEMFTKQAEHYVS